MRTIDGFDTDRDSFLGAYGENRAPEVVMTGKAKNSVASGWAPVGSHHMQVSPWLRAKAETFVFVLGICGESKRTKNGSNALKIRINRKPCGSYARQI